MKTKQWYQNRLAKYFTDNYEEYTNTAAFYNNPAINQWLFDIPELKTKVKLTCEDDGTVTNKIYYLGADYNG